ncbi:hypothetical protein MKX01_019963 [Papaver californicum]|nr:hypothetical protein MKX01_019963 [Papaver californicum]
MPMEYNEYGLPVDIGSVQFATRLGIIARSVVPPGIKDWKQVSKNMKEEIWNRIRSTYNVPESAKKMVLTKANKSWKYKKITLYVICDEALTNGIKFIENRERTKVARSCVKKPHSTGRKGILKLEHRMKKESPDGMVDKPVLYMATHVYRNIPDDPLHPKHIAAKKVEKVREIYECDPNSSTQKHLDSDVVTSVLARDRKGYICGMSGEISKT